MDDIRTEPPPATQTEPGQTVPGRAPKPPLREIGPESEVRGGPEADDDGTHD